MIHLEDAVCICPTYAPPPAPPPPPPSPQAVVDLISQCISANPQRRPTAAQALQALRETPLRHT